MLFTILTAYSPPAPAGLKEICDALLSRSNEAPRAIGYDRARPDSFTAHADEFTQVIWKAYVTNQPVMEVESEFFSRFIGKNLPEFERVHEHNRKLAEQEMGNKVLSRHEKVLRQFQLMDEYIAHLRFRLKSGPHFKYKEMIVFSINFILIHEIEAFDKLKNLAEEGEDAAKLRYPRLNYMKSIWGTVNDRRHHGHISQREDFWTRSYTKFLNMLDREDYSFLVGFSKILPLPTMSPTGSPAFFNTYHLPVSPFYLSTEFIPEDNRRLMSPLDNYNHEEGHRQRSSDNAYGLPTKNSKHAELEKDLREIKMLIEAKNDPILSNVFYYTVYFIRFERLRTIPFTVKGLQTELQDSLSNFVNGIDEMRSLFSDLPAQHSPVNGSKELETKSANRVFAEKLAKAIVIVSEYEARNSFGARWTYSFRQKSIQEAYERNIRRIKKMNL